MARELDPYERLFAILAIVIILVLAATDPDYQEFFAGLDMAMARDFIPF